MDKKCEAVRLTSRITGAFAGSDPVFGVQEAMELADWPRNARPFRSVVCAPSLAENRKQGLTPPPNPRNPRAAGNNFEFRIPAPRGSVCDGLFGIRCTQPTYGFTIGLVNWSAFKTHQMLNLGLALIQ